MEIEVGKKYIVGAHSKEKGNIIEITKISGWQVFYRTLKGKGFGVFNYFVKGSMFANELTPLQPAVRKVHRPAKVGEYVEIVEVSDDTPENAYEIGDILKIVSVEKDTRSNYAMYGKYAGEYLYTWEYVVLEGYQPLYNGKVVCVSTICTTLTAGKVYEIVDGVITYDDGTKSTKLVREYEDLERKFVSKFIKFVE